MREVRGGKSLLALIAMRDALTPEIRKSWYAGTFETIQTSQGIFDELNCNLVYHFGKHGEKFGTIAEMTFAARRYFQENRSKAKLENGMLRFPNRSTFTLDGLIVTFW